PALQRDSSRQAPDSRDFRDRRAAALSTVRRGRWTRHRRSGPRARVRLVRAAGTTDGREGRLRSRVGDRQADPRVARRLGARRAVGAQWRALRCRLARKMNFIMRLVWACALSLVAFAAGAHNKSPAIVGTWKVITYEDRTEREPSTRSAAS